MDLFRSVLLCLLWIPLAAWPAAPMVAAGGRHVLALETNGSLYAWGVDSAGQLGSGRPLRAAAPVQVALSGPIAQLAAGDSHSLALDAQGRVWAWGRNSVGQLGDGSKSDRATPVSIGSGFSAIAASGKLSVALKSDGSVWAWGYGGNSGMVFPGMGTATPTRIGDGFAQISAGYGIILALQPDGTLVQWTGAITATPVSLGQGFAQIAAGQGWSTTAPQSLALKSDGSLWAWGYGETTPSRVQIGGTFSRISVGCKNFLGLTSEGGMVQLDIPGATQTVVGTGYAAMAAGLDYSSGGFYSLALTTDGRLMAWGTNTYGRLGDGTTTDRAAPVLVGSGFSGMAAGEDHAVGLKNDGTVWAWGDNNVGQLGDGAAIRRATPFVVGDDFAFIAAGGNHSLAIGQDGSLWAWGDNSCGQLGDGTLTNQSAPIEIGGNYSALAAHGSRSLALKADGSLWSWGEEVNSNSGDNGYGARCVTVPTQVGSGFVQIAAGGSHAFALKADGTLWAWGNNQSGQLGDGSAILRTEPVLVGSGFSAVAAGQFNSLAVKTDGSLWAWGGCTFGAVTAACATPAQIAANGFATVAAGWEHNLALKGDGSLWAWGANGYGALGDGTTLSRNAPVPVGEYSSALAAGYHFSVALAGDGTVRVWGLANEGQLGNGLFSDATTAQLVINAEVSGFLDLDPVTANDIPAAAIPPFLAQASKTGDLDALSFSVDVRGLLGSDFAGSRAGGYDVYVGAYAGAGGSLNWYQLDAGRNWSGLAWPMAQFMSGVTLSSRTDSVIVEILDGVDVSALVGSHIYVGYGTDAEEMLAAGRYREVMTISAPPAQ